MNPSHHPARTRLLLSLANWPSQAEIPVSLRRRPATREGKQQASNMRRSRRHEVLF